MILGLALVFNLVWVVAVVAALLFISSAFGTRFWLLGRPWPLVRRALRLGPPAELEHEYPPRFAQALGFVALSLSLIAFVLGAPVVGVGPRRRGDRAPDPARGHRHLRRLPALLPALVRPEPVRAPDHRPQRKPDGHPEHDAPDAALSRLRGASPAA